MKLLSNISDFLKLIKKVVGTLEINSHFLYKFLLYWVLEPE